jgi:hypothetical protein
MSQSNIPRQQIVPEFWQGSEEEHRRKIGQAVNAILRGVTNNHFKVTLEANETTTEVMFPPVREGAGVQITPGSASAATSFATGAIWVETKSEKAIIHHDSTSDTDRVFHLVFSG